MKCAYTGVLISDASEGIWGDGEWTSWDYIDSVLGDYTEEEPKPLRECSYKELLEVVKNHFESDEEIENGFPIYGEIGELYIESRFGMVRHEPYTQGSDGKIGQNFVEVKTISPLRDSRDVRVKRAGNFNVLAIVKIDCDLRIDAKLIKRSRLPKGQGKYTSAKWDDFASDHIEIAENCYI